MDNVLLKVADLKKHHLIKRGIIRREVGSVKAVDGISFDIPRGETMGLVGESGCGKSTTSRVILQLQPATAGQVFFTGADGQRVELTALKGEPLRRIRRKIQMIFQDPYASLDPRMTVRDIIGEPLIVHGVAHGKAVEERVEELLKVVGLSPLLAKRNPHELSGGQQQRVGIARALALNPELIVCDEPISALDVSIQAQVINLLEDLQERFNLTYLFIAHDLSMVRHISDRVAVMYLGVIVELASRDNLYKNPLHPYTQALLSAVPVPDPVVEENRRRVILQGDVPSPVNPPSGCRFHTRCPIAQGICREERPGWRDAGGGHFVACHYSSEVNRSP
jgi:oligopeptide transport system ATP-binding protein